MKNKGSGNVCRSAKEYICMLNYRTSLESLVVSRGIFDPKFCFLLLLCYKIGSGEKLVKRIKLPSEALNCFYNN